MLKQDLTWIHFSDLHIEKNNRYKQRVLFNALWKDIKKFKKIGISPDFIAFTGDIASHGWKEEYDYAIEDFFEPLLKYTDLDKEMLFLVPGNHDSDWNVTSKLKNPLSQIKDSDDIDLLVEQQDSKDKLLSPFQNYSQFCQYFLGCHKKFENPAFYNVQFLNIYGFKVAILCLNSSWLSGFNRDQDGKVNDRGKLAISEAQVILAQSLCKNANFIIAIQHHPFEWLMDYDRYVVERRLVRSCNILLYGHLHHPNILKESSLVGDILKIPAGTLYQSLNFPNAYNYCHIDFLNGVGTIYLRRYNPEQEEWQKDDISTGEEKEGKSNFNLPKMWFSNALILEDERPPKNIRDYSFIFTDKCKNDMSLFGLTKNDIITLVDNEFRSHINYYDFDLQDYPLPVKSEYTIHLNKIERTITFNRILSCTKNQAKKDSWNNILASWRRATHLAYRDDPKKLLSERGIIKRVSILHSEIRNRIKRHFLEYEKLQVDMLSRKAYESCHSQESNSIQIIDSDLKAIGDEIAHHLEESVKACREVVTLLESLDIGDITPDVAIKLITIEFERSLQHIHKIVLNFSPTE